MRSKLIKIIIILFIFISKINSTYADDFNFNVTEIEITDNGNFFKGSKEELLLLMTVLFLMQMSSNIIKKQIF